MLSCLVGVILYWMIWFFMCDVMNNFWFYDVVMVRELGVESMGGFEVVFELIVKVFCYCEKIIEFFMIWRD